MSDQNESKLRVAHLAQKQQLMGLKDAMLGRPMNVAKGMMLRRTKKGTPPKTHYESAYDNFSKGRDRAREGGYITAREEKSPYLVLGFYSTRHMLDLVSGNFLSPGQPAALAVVTKTPAPEVTERTAPVPTSGLAHGAVGHVMTWNGGTITVIGTSEGKPDQLVLQVGDKTDFASVLKVPCSNSPQWVQMYWGYMYIDNDGRAAGLYDLKKPESYKTILEAMTGMEDEPIACPTEAHPMIQQFWADLASGIRDYLTGGYEDVRQLFGVGMPGQRKIGFSYAKQENLKSVIEWDETMQQFRSVADEATS